jgi:hypothetical protein
VDCTWRGAPALNSLGSVLIAVQSVAVVYVVPVVVAVQFASLQGVPQYSVHIKDVFLDSILIRMVQ